jgi:type IV secretion system protein VirD4
MAIYSLSWAYESFQVQSNIDARKREVNCGLRRPRDCLQLKERHALVVAENGKPIIARLTRCIDGKSGAQLLASQEQVRSRLSDARRMVVTPEARTTAALVEAKRRGLIDQWSEQ